VVAPLLGHDRLRVDSAGPKGLGPHHVRAAQQSAEEPRDVEAPRDFRGGILGLCAALVPVVVLWGYTVDDALVTARVAHHLATGVGYRFNADGPVVDAVTPLGYAHLLAPFARDGVVQTWQAARWLGAICWLAAAVGLGIQIERAGRNPWRWAGLVPLACCVPVAAWVGSGMETGIVVALATCAVGRHRWWLLGAGMAAAWRPELVPWAVVVALGRVWGDRQWPRGLALALALVAGPPVIAALVRTVAFGSPTPLAVMAKPSDLHHGVVYALGALIWSGLPILAVAPFALRNERRAAGIVAAFGAHLLALVLAGGDWMALFRLAVPVLPSLVLVAALVAERARPWATGLRTAGATAIGLLLFWFQGGAARSVAEHRTRLMAEAAPLLADARRVAAVDIGWVGATTTAHVVDLAGITDPTIAVLAGGHTTKRVGSDLLRRRNVDHVVLLLAPDQRPADDWARSDFAKGVGARVAMEAASEGFRVEGTIALGGTRQRYIVVSRADVE
jgi:hypothetical protein